MSSKNESSTVSHPVLIQGGMGVSISSWRLAKAVARRGHMGVVSGTALDSVIAARLQEGDIGGELRRAFDAFPNRELADRVYYLWHSSKGLSESGVYKRVPMFSEKPPIYLLELTVLSAFAEVWLAKEERTGPIGINLLEKVQAPTLPLLYGAMLGGVDYVLMGAGIPRDIPGHLDRLLDHQICALRLNLDNDEPVLAVFNPAIMACEFAFLERPRFLAIVSSHILAMSLARSGGVDGFVLEGPMAGGHNAPPRGWTPASNDEPIYGERDEANLERVARLGLPFWLAGAQDDSESLGRAQSAGATGIQVGTAFAFCSDSGMENEVRRRAIEASLDNRAETRTEGRGSPTGFPFKTLSLEGSEGARPAGERKRQTCTHGYLRSAYRKKDGGIGWRCAAEPESHYVMKGGDLNDCTDRRCLCNGLLATAGHAHRMKSGELERPLITSGYLRCLRELLGDKEDYDANDVIDRLGLTDGPGALSATNNARSSGG